MKETRIMSEETKSITTSNMFAMAKKKKVLSKPAQRLYARLVSQIQITDDCFHRYEINASQFARMMNIPKKNAKAILYETVMELFRYEIYLRRKDDALATSLVSSVAIKRHEPSFNLEVSQELRNEFLQLRDNYCQLSLEVLLSFDNIYSPNMYAFLKSKIHTDQKKYTFMCKIPDLRQILGIKEDQYLQYKIFNRDVLQVIQKEFEEKAQITFTYEAERAGKSFRYLHITINRKEKLPEHLSIYDTSIPETQEPATPKLSPSFDTSKFCEATVKELNLN